MLFPSNKSSLHILVRSPIIYTQLNSISTDNILHSDQVNYDSKVNLQLPTKARIVIVYWNLPRIVYAELLTSQFEVPFLLLTFIFTLMQNAVLLLLLVIVIHNPGRFKLKFSFSYFSSNCFAICYQWLLEIWSDNEVMFHFTFKSSSQSIRIMRSVNSIGNSLKSRERQLEEKKTFPTEKNLFHERLWK